MSRYRWRGNSIGAAPSRIMVGEMDVIVGEVSFVMNVDAFLACFALDEEVVATDSPTAPETAVVVITPVLALPVPVCELPQIVADAPKALGKGHSKHYGGSWVCEGGHLVAGGRKCPSCGATHPALINRTLLRKSHSTGGGF